MAYYLSFQGCNVLKVESLQVATTRIQGFLVANLVVVSSIVVEVELEVVVVVEVVVG